jgi:hypothetical protein
MTAFAKQNDQFSKIFSKGLAATGSRSLQWQTSGDTMPSMSRVRVLDTLETDRLILRHSSVDEAAIYRQLWTERDLRVPPYRRINSEGRPTVEDIAAQILAEREESGPGFWRWSGRARATSSGIAG